MDKYKLSLIDSRNIGNRDYIRLDNGINNLPIFYHTKYKMYELCISEGVISHGGGDTLRNKIRAAINSLYGEDMIEIHYGGTCPYSTSNKKCIETLIAVMQMAMYKYSLGMEYINLDIFLLDYKRLTEYRVDNVLEKINSTLP